MAVKQNNLENINLNFRPSFATFSRRTVHNSEIMKLDQGYCISSENDVISLTLLEIDDGI